MRKSFMLALAAAVCVLLSAPAVDAEDGHVVGGQIERRTPGRRAEEAEEKFVKATLPKIAKPAGN
jgi:hypothetical protein